ncbi:MAG: TraR/DksA family transcriptional regulator [Acidimicrobiia bacterium]
MDIREPDAELDLSALERVEAELHDVERALARIDEGTYGTCEACGAGIGDDRLAEDPTVRTCAAHAVAPGTPG